MTKPIDYAIKPGDIIVSRSAFANDDEYNVFVGTFPKDKLCVVPADVIAHTKKRGMGRRLADAFRSLLR